MISGTFSTLPKKWHELRIHLHHTLPLLPCNPVPIKKPYGVSDKFWIMNPFSGYQVFDEKY